MENAKWGEKKPGTLGTGVLKGSRGSRARKEDRQSGELEENKRSVDSRYQRKREFPEGKNAATWSERESQTTKCFKMVWSFLKTADIEGYFMARSADLGVRLWFSLVFEDSGNGFCHRWEVSTETWNIRCSWYSCVQMKTAFPWPLSRWRSYVKGLYVKGFPLPSSSRPVFLRAADTRQAPLCAPCAPSGVSKPRRRSNRTPPCLLKGSLTNSKVCRPQVHLTPQNWTHTRTKYLWDGWTNIVENAELSRIFLFTTVGWIVSFPKS